MNGTEEQRRELRTSLILLVEEYMAQLGTETVVQELNHCLRTILVREMIGEISKRVIDYLPEPLRSEVLRNAEEQHRRQKKDLDHLEGS